MSLTRFQHIAGIIALSLLLAHHAIILAGSSTQVSTGAVWSTVQFNLDSADLRLRDMKFINSTHGWIVGDDITGTYGGIVLNTNDSGESWNLQLNNSSQHHEQICIINDQIWVTGKSSLYYSLDWGVTWNESAVISESAWMSFVRFINSTHGWTATMGTLHKTVNGGLSWQEVPGWSFNGDVPRDIQFISDKAAWAIGFFGIYYTADCCETWIQKYEKGGGAFSFVDTIEAWAVGDIMLAHMTDGESWTEVAPPRRTPFLRSSPYFSDVIFLDEDNGWIVGGITDDVHILYTPNGGQDWYEQSISTQIIARLMAVDFINETYGWAVGSDGVILRTTHGNSLGTRLWFGLTDPIFLTYIAGVIGVSVVAAVLFIYYYKRRRIHHSPALDSSASGIE